VAASERFSSASSAFSKRSISSVFFSLIGRRSEREAKSSFFNQ